MALSFVGSRGKAWVQAKDIAAGTGIPKPYLSKILHALGKAGMIHTKRGLGGGVALARPAGEVTLLAVAQAVQAVDRKPRCILGMATCSDDKPCPMHGFWQTTQEHIRAQLSQTTLEQIAAYQAQTGFKTMPLAELLHDLPIPRRAYNTKPTGRFMRKFGVSHIPPDQAPV